MGANPRSTRRELTENGPGLAAWISSESRPITSASAAIAAVAAFVDQPKRSPMYLLNVSTCPARVPSNHSWRKAAQARSNWGSKPLETICSGVIRASSRGRSTRGDFALQRRRSVDPMAATYTRLHASQYVLRIGGKSPLTATTSESRSIGGRGG
jgi:hypothetical protein